MIALIYCLLSVTYAVDYTQLCGEVAGTQHIVTFQTSIKYTTVYYGHPPVTFEAELNRYSIGITSLMTGQTFSESGTIRDGTTIHYKTPTGAHLTLISPRIGFSAWIFTSEEYEAYHAIKKNMRVQFHDGDDHEGKALLGKCASFKNLLPDLNRVQPLLKLFCYTSDCQIGYAVQSHAMEEWIGASKSNGKCEWKYIRDLPLSIVGQSDLNGQRSIQLASKFDLTEKVFKRQKQEGNSQVCEFY